MKARRYVSGDLERWALPILANADFGDPLSKQCDWHPVTFERGIQYPSHRARKISPTRVEIHPNFFMRIYLAIGLLVSSLLTIAAFSDFLFGGAPFFVSDPRRTLGMGFLIWTLAMLVLLIRSNRLVVLDIQKNRFVSDPGVGGKNLDDLSEIHALQIVPEILTGRKVAHRGSLGRSRFVFELNFVLKDGSRIPVVNHSDLKETRRTARLIASILQPSPAIWDACEVLKIDPEKGKYFPDQAADPFGRS